MSEVIATASAPSSADSVEDRVANVLYGQASPDGSEIPEGEEGEPEQEQGEENEGEGAKEEAATLAQYLGLNEDQVFEGEDGKVYVNAKVDGEVTPVPFQELVKSYQIQKHLTQKSMQLSDKMKNVDAEYQQIITVAQNKFHVLDQMTEALEAKFIGEYQGVDWQRLRRENPAEYVAAQKDYEDAYRNLQHAKQVAIEQRQELEAVQKQRQQASYQQHLVSQAALVLQKIPEWQDPVVRANETAKMRSGLGEYYGFEQHELDGISDHRMLSVIKDAIAFRAGSSVAQNKVNKQVPKFQKAGTVKNDMVKQREAKTIKANLRNSGSIGDLANAILNRM